MMTIWIGGLPWVLKLERDLCGGGGEVCGLCCYDYSLIVVKYDLSVSARRRVFWHEAFHAALFQAGIISDDHSELHIEILASAVVSMLALNPMLVDPNFLYYGPTIDGPSFEPPALPPVTAETLEPGPRDATAEPPAFLVA